MADQFIPPESGFVQALPQEQYHGVHTHVSSHGLMKVLRSPAHWKAQTDPDTHAKEPSDAMRFGKLVHTAVLEPHLFLNEYKVVPDFGPMQSSKNRAARDAWMSDQPPGTVFVAQDEMDVLAGMLETLKNHPLAFSLLNSGIPEVSGFWTCPDTGIKCRMRPDYLREDSIIVDYKTAKDASEDAFRKACFSSGYYIQAAFYMEGYKQIKGVESKGFVFLVQEKERPYAIAMYELDPAYLELGRIKVRKAIDIFKECLENNRWPAYQEQILSLAPPAYAFYE